MSNQVLSQDEIDAMVSTVSSEQAAPSVAGGAIAPGPAPPEMSSQTGEAARASESLYATVAQLAERLDRAEAALSRIDRLETAMAEVNAAGGPASQSVQAVAKQLQTVSSKVEEILSNLQDTMVYAARKTFVCRSCASQGYVAASVKCTQCGQQTWLGWVPKK